MWTRGLPATEITSGFQAAQKSVIDYAKEKAKASFSIASDLASAKDVQGVLSLQTHFARSQMQAYAVQTQELGKMMSEAMQGMTQSAEAQVLSSPS